MGLKNKIGLFAAVLLLVVVKLSFAQDIVGSSHWELYEGGILLNAMDGKNIPYSDNIEMSGVRVAAIVKYAIDTSGRMEVNREIFFPQLHEFKKNGDSWFHDYRAYLKGEFSDKYLPKLYLNKEQVVPGKVTEVRIKGMLTVSHAPSSGGLAIVRTFLPSMTERLFEEVWEIRNTTDSVMELTSANIHLNFEDLGAKGIYSRQIISDLPAKILLDPNEVYSYATRFMAKMQDESFPQQKFTSTVQERNDFLKVMSSSLELKTPNPVLNQLFEFSKIRASESIYESELGLIHSPGGGRYYVGIWANDQAEYINPFFPYLGYTIGNESAMNTYRAFAKEMNPEYSKIRYSFEVEGLVPPFLKDRGDAAMIAYGAAHYALALGDKKVAKELWPLIEWCLEYNKRQLNKEGVVLSESDEMEGRIETGTANLSTSSLYFGALTLSSKLASALDIPKKQVKAYLAERDKLGIAIEKYFGADIDGLHTYKYYKEHQELRHWICLPLVVGIEERKEGTIEALFDFLWTDNGVHVEKNSDNPEIGKIFWDRGTLYALRGTFFSGESEKSLERLEQFSNKRLLGDRVPYVVEAFPEGSMAHLSAESALYCRVFIEGVFGIQPSGFNSFSMKPVLPEKWDTMSLNKIKSFGEDFNIEVKREEDKIQVFVYSNSSDFSKKYIINPGETICVKFKN
ncbi:hypothetical protein [Algoriphagus aquimarinus]|uniref:hypothetical protein n=1 Tax=Algoriphagus aquimarinus TaxID=237018 RepID=UPI0030D736D6|tara:strand:+ start:17647 stop:19695 length:2049 start_codon:yes stop_codon:yes gene_type:complete